MTGNNTYKGYDWNPRYNTTQIGKSYAYEKTLPHPWPFPSDPFAWTDWPGCVKVARAKGEAHVR